MKNPKKAFFIFVLTIVVFKLTINQRAAAKIVVEVTKEVSFDVLVCGESPAPTNDNLSVSKL